MTKNKIWIKKASGFNFEISYYSLSTLNGTMRTLEITDCEKTMNGDSLNSTFIISLNDIDLNNTDVHNKEQIKRFFEQIIRTL